MEKILKDILDGEYEKNERLDAVLADNYGIIQGHSLYCMYIFLGKYYESEKKEVGLFLEELKEHNPNGNCAGCLVKNNRPHWSALW